MYAESSEIHTSPVNGERKLKSVVTLVVGFLNKMLMPVFIKGNVKSTASARLSVIVKSTTAMSATLLITSPKEKKQIAKITLLKFVVTNNSTWKHLKNKMMSLKHAC